MSINMGTLLSAYRAKVLIHRFLVINLSFSIRMGLIAGFDFIIKGGAE